MKFFFITMTSIWLATIAAFAAPSETCVPTMPIEQAKMIYETGIKTAASNLQADYALASANCDQGYTAAKTAHARRLQDAQATFDLEVTQIKAELAADWRQALDAATEKHNQALKDSQQIYDSQTTEQKKVYQADLAQAQATYDLQVHELAQQYNQAVCAKP